MNDYMKRGLIVWTLVLSGVFVACRPGGRADRDVEFDSGSPVTEIKINAQSSRNLTKLGKVWGYIKYFHPAVAAGRFNMDAELFRVLPSLLEARSNEEANRVIERWTRRFGSVRQASVVSDSVAAVFMKPDLSWITPEYLGDRLSDYLSTLQQAVRPDSGYYYAYDTDGTVRFLHEREHEQITDPGYRLLALYRFWNACEYFNPNLPAVGYDWDHALSGNLVRFVRSTDEMSYRLNMLFLISQVMNSQCALAEADTLLETLLGDRLLPLKLRIIGDEAIVTGYLDRERGEKSGFQVGDVLRKVGSYMVEDGVFDKGAYISGSNGVVMLDRIAALLSRTADSVCQIEQFRNRRIKTTMSPTYPLSELHLPGTTDRHGLETLRFTADGILYLPMSRLTTEQTADVFAGAARAKGIIFDLRDGASADWIEPLCGFFYPSRKVFAQRVWPAPGRPGLFFRGEDRSVGKTNPEAPTCPVTILVGPETSDSCELLLMALQQIPGAKTVGYVTAGSQGELSELPMPGGFHIRLATTTICYPDGKTSQYPGIVPDYIVEPEVETLSAGIDDDFITAVKVIKGEPIELDSEEEY